MAGVSMRGSDEQLKRLQRQLQSVKSRAFQARLYKNLGQEALTQVAISFDRQEDPYGKRWAPTVRGGQVLSDTGRLRNSFNAPSNTRGYSIGTRVKYAGFHQDGTRHLKRRSFLPVGGRLGTRWRQAFENIARRMVARELEQRTETRGG